MSAAMMRSKLREIVSMARSRLGPRHANFPGMRRVSSDRACNFVRRNQCESVSDVYYSRQ